MRQGELRVLHVMREASGGMITHLSALVGALHELGVESMVAGPAGVLRRLTERPGEAEAPRRALLVELPLGDGVRPAADARAALRLRRLVRELRPDVVHAHGHKAAWTVWLAAPRQPLRILTIHNFLPVRRPGWRAAAERAVARSVLRRADAVIAVSDTLRAFTQAVLGGTGSPTVRVVRNALEPAWLLRVQRRPHAGDAGGAVRGVPDGARPPEASPGAVPSGSRVVIACAVRLHDPKGVATLVEAAARLPREVGEVWIAGDGPQRAALEAKARSLGLDGRLRWLGWADPAAVWAEADIAVLPWLREGASYSALEAMAAGVPVVSFDCPGCREVLRDGAGLIVADPTAEALASALSELARDPLRRREMGERARRLATGRTSLDMGRETLEVYEEARAGVPPSGGRR